DRGRRISALFEVNPISKHDGAVECETGLRTVPGDELANGVVVGALAAGGRQAVQDGCLGVFEVRERQDALRRLLLARFRLGHRRRPPSPSPTASSSLTAAFVARQRAPAGTSQPAVSSFATVSASGGFGLALIKRLACSTSPNACLRSTIGPKVAPNLG